MVPYLGVEAPASAPDAPDTLPARWGRRTEGGTRVNPETELEQLPPGVSPGDMDELTPTEEGPEAAESEGQPT